MRVLIVEDEPTLGKQLKSTLEANGYAVDLSVDGEDGLREFDVPVESPEEALSDRIGLAEVMDRLDSGDRQLIRLRFFAGRTQSETA